MFEGLIDRIAAQLNEQKAAYEKAVQDIGAYKTEVKNQYDAELVKINDAKSEFVQYARNYQDSKNAFTLDAANAQQLKSAQSVQAVTVEKTNKIPFIILAGVLGYLYWKGKIKV